MLPDKENLENLTNEELDKELTNVIKELVLCAGQTGPNTKTAFREKPLRERQDKIMKTMRDRGMLIKTCDGIDAEKMKKISINALAVGRLDELYLLSY